MSARLIMCGSVRNVEKNFIKEGILMYDKTVTVFNKYTVDVGRILKDGVI